MLREKQVYSNGLGMKRLSRERWGKPKTSEIYAPYRTATVDDCRVGSSRWVTESVREIALLFSRDTLRL
jgi:hypothetical protein